MASKPHLLKTPEEEIDHKHLWYQVQHLHEDVDELKDAVKENRTFFQERLDKLDNRIWWVLGISMSTMVTVLIAVFTGVS